MDAIQMLKDDHARVRELFKQFEEAGENAHVKKQKIAEKTFAEITVHSQLEEEIFYPAVRATGEKGEELVLAGIEEHRIADFMLERLHETQPDDESFEAKYKVLTESVEHHLKEEEREMFPHAKKALGDELDQLGSEMHERKPQLQAQMPVTA